LFGIRPGIGHIDTGRRGSEISLTDDQAAPASRTPILFSLGLILVYPLFSVPVQASIHNLIPKIGEVDARIVTEAAIWIYAAIVLAIALFWERRTLASIGLRKPTFASLWFGIGGALAMAGAGALAAYVVYDLLHYPAHADAQAGSLVGGSVIYALCISVRGGIIEEIFYRGLGIEQLTVFTGRRRLSAIIATLVFIAVHALHFDWIQLVPIAAVATVLATLYLWRHDLWANIVAHIAVDSAGLVSLALQTHKLTH
jgi:membrane protease YdiL (CAAX protease family)